VGKKTGTVVKSSVVASFLRKEAEKKGCVKPSAVLADNLIYGKNQTGNPTKGVEILRIAYDKGDLLAITIMGELYYNGYPHKKFIIPNPEKGLSCFCRAHAAGVPRATLGYAQALIKGKGCSQDIPEAQRLLESITEKEPLAKVSLALLYKEGLIGQDKSAIERHDIAMNLLCEAITKDCPQAHTQLGIIYETGERVPKNLRFAFSYYKKASIIGDPHARTRLGHLYKNNQLPPGPQLNLKVRLKEALSYYRSAHNSGDASGTYYLSTFHHSGTLIKRNIKRAGILLERAYGMGELNAIAMTTFLHFYLCDGDCHENITKARELLDHTIKKGCSLAYYLKAKILVYTRNPLYYKEVNDLIKKAKKLKIPQIYEVLGVCHQLGIMGKEVDNTKAFKYFSLCNERIALPTCKMFLTYLYGEGPSEIRDPEKANLLLQEAALLGNDAAKEFLEKIKTQAELDLMFQRSINEGGYLSDEPAIPNSYIDPVVVPHEET
jgi:uncharacterized protein